MEVVNPISFHSLTFYKAYEQGLQEYIIGRGVDKFLFNGRKITNSIITNMSFNNGTNTYGFTLSLNDKRLIVTSERLGYVKNNNPYDLASTQSYPELQIQHHYKFATPNRSEFIRDYLTNLKRFHFHDVGELSPFNNDVNIIDNRTLQSKGGNLAAILYRLKNEDNIVYNRIIKTIQSVAPYFKDFDLQPNGSLISLTWRDKYSENLYSAVNLSDGTLRFVALVTLFMQSNLPETIIIDEPELGLHPHAIRKLAGMIRSAASRGSQVILATQSADLVNEFNFEDNNVNILSVDLINGESVLKPINYADWSIWLENYTLGDLWKQNIINVAQPN
ncbi:MAG: AAA family ATPase [Bacteroidales bacterium]|jgi:hypothetical protein|nr:AAA family ATPase [Bacteroidales bacterium]